MAQLEPKLAALLAHWRSLGLTVVFTNGVFDLLHPGHLSQLEAARAEGDVLVVGLNSDASVKRQGKGHDRPLLDEGARALMLRALRCVDAVAVFDEDTPLELIKLIQPDVLVKGADYAGREVVGREIVETRGGRVVLVPLLQGYSTTSLLRRIRGES
jgi:D-beta-D-heptose 7-phosphate kinase/D-beta-D-heptose 1-phosphate adenosyltransferase